MIETFIGSFIGSFLVISVFHAFHRKKMNALMKECALAKLQIRQIVAHINTSRKFSPDLSNYIFPDLELEPYDE